MFHDRTKRSRRPTTLISSQVSQRLEKLRERRRNLWADDDDDNEYEENHSEAEKRKNSRVRIVLSDSEDDAEEFRPQVKKRTKPKKPHCCLICSIVNQLSNENCCAKHLSLLKNLPSNSSSSSSLILPNHVMILPVHDNLLHQYLDSHEIHRLKVKTKSITTQTKQPVKNDK